MTRIYSVVFLVIALCALAGSRAEAETVNCTAITTLPYTITTQGVYCLTGHLSTGIATGNAITIDANNVVLDMNGFKIGGLSAGLGTQANGIYALQRQNITIRNGTVRGFYIGINFFGSPTNSQGHVIEDIRADQNTYAGMQIIGNGSIVRNNQVVTTGGSTLFVGALGMLVSGDGARVLNNDVSGVAALGSDNAIGIQLAAAGNSVIAGNRVSSIASLGARYGILISGSTGVIVSDNRLSGTQNGIFFIGATGKYFSNVTQDVTTPYTGGTAAGTTNY